MARGRGVFRWALVCALTWGVVGMPVTARGAAKPPHGAAKPAVGPAVAARPSPALPDSTPLDRWLPNAPDASWTYAWSDSRYSPAPTLERYTVAARTDATVKLAWTTDDTGNGPDVTAAQGTIDYVYGDGGLANSNWASTAPPSQFPVLCASATQCGNSLSGTHYLLIWGSRAPVLQEPLTTGATWNSLGGQGNDVASVSRVAGVERVTVPGFPRGVFATKVVSDVTQAGAIGDPYGSGQRRVWWVYGVGPVRIEFAHAGGELEVAQLQATNLVPRPAPSDQAYLPLIEGTAMRFSYSNSRYMKTPSRQEITVAQVRNTTARLDVRELSGPIVVRGSYVFSSGLSGVRNLSLATSAATRVKFPELGPRGLPASQRRRFFTPLDLMAFGYNPVLPAYPYAGESWRSSPSSRDRAVYGVTGTTTVIGTRAVTTPAGRFEALLVRSTLRQAGFPFGSGVRDAWFAPGKGLVKLVFRHADGSVSTVQRLK